MRTPWRRAAIAQVLDHLEPLDDGCTYRFQASVRRRYERLADFPDGLVVIGDALCSFDPAFGQGMSVAALEAVVLRATLAEGRTGLGRRFFARAAHHVETPWQIVVGGMPPAPGATARKPFPERLLGSYLTALRYAAVDDPALASAFLRVAHLTAPPRSLTAPRYVARVLARGVLNRAAGAGPAPGFARAPAIQPPGHTGPVQHQTGNLS